MDTNLNQNNDNGMNNSLPQEPINTSVDNQTLNINEGTPVTPVQQEVAVNPSVQPTNNGFSASAMPTPTSTEKAGTNGISALLSNKKLLFGLIGAVIGIIVLIILIVVFGGGKKLVCTKSETAEGTITETKYVLNFKGSNSVPSVKETLTMDLSKDETISEENIKSQVDQLNETAKSKKDGEYSVSYSGKVVTVKATYTSDQYYNQNKSSIDKMDDKTIKGYKKHFESIGYTCK